VTRDLTARLRWRKPIVSPHREYREYITRNYSPEVSANLVTQRHGRDWLVFGTIGLAVPE
jgi:hypothetical protein